MSNRAAGRHAKLVWSGEYNSLSNLVVLPCAYKTPHRTMRSHMRNGLSGGIVCLRCSLSLSLVGLLIVRSFVICRLVSVFFGVFAFV